MRHLTASIFLLAFLAQTFSKGILAADYLLNTQAYINACVNKEKPQLSCKGKCQLGKKMTEQENRSAPVPFLKDAGKTEVLSTRSYPPASGFAIWFVSIIRIPATDVAHAVDQSFSIFHPPRHLAIV